MGKKIDEMCVVVSDNNIRIPWASISFSFVSTLSEESLYILSILIIIFLFLCYVIVSLWPATEELYINREVRVNFS